MQGRSCWGQREIEAEKNIGMTEQKRFQLFQKEFEKVKNNIGKLILDKSAQSSLMSILPFTNDAQMRIFLQKLPLRLTCMEQLENAKYAPMKIGNMKDIVGVVNSEMTSTTDVVGSLQITFLEQAQFLKKYC